MPDDSSLMAHLVPRLTSQVENAATDALAYILNRSEGSMKALNDLLREGGFAIEPIVRLGTQPTYEDRSRPDMAGYDKKSMIRLLVEVKFWAALLEGQASWYAQLFDQPGPAVLLFIAPEVRIPTLWVEIDRQMTVSSGLEHIDAPPGVRRAKVSGKELHLVLTSWVRLLDRMDFQAEDDGVKSDIRQLRGLARSQGDQVFLPLRSEELSPSLARRMGWYSQLVNNAVDARGVREGWMDTKRLRQTSRHHGYGRYFHFSGVKGDFWLGINHDLWARSSATPIWLWVTDRTAVNMDEVESKLNVQTQGEWIPIHLKTGVEYDKVLEGVISQLKRVAEIAGAELKVKE